MVFMAPFLCFQEKWPAAGMDKLPYNVWVVRFLSSCCSTRSYFLSCCLGIHDSPWLVAAWRPLWDAMCVCVLASKGPWRVCVLL